MRSSQEKSALTATMITAGTSIGAGMFSIPLVGSGMWFEWMIVALLFLWFLNYLTSLYLMEVTLSFERGSSFNEIVKTLLGGIWNSAFGLAFAFLMMILLYAYFSAFGSTARETFGLSELASSRWLSGGVSFVFGMALAVIVWWSTAAVGKISTILIVGMVITFFLSMLGFSFQIEVTKLFDVGGSGYAKYFWIALSSMMTAFAFATIVPSLYKYYGNKPKTIKMGLLLGSILAFFVYLFFVAVMFGNVSRSDFALITQANGNIGDLVAALQSGSDSNLFNSALSVFSNFAVVSSFIGVSLGLFDYFADRFAFADDRKGRFYAACLTFLPPGIASFFFPNGFLLAIGYAGLIAVMIFGSFFFLVSKSRSEGRSTSYVVPGGRGLLYFFLAANILIGTCQILAMMGYLPKW